MLQVIPHSEFIEKYWRKIKRELQKRATNKKMSMSWSTV
jgi:hypothetical protein